MVTISTTTALLSCESNHMMISFRRDHSLFFLPLSLFSRSLVRSFSLFLNSTLSLSRSNSLSILSLSLPPLLPSCFSLWWLWMVFQSGSISGLFLPLALRVLESAMWYSLHRRSPDIFFSCGEDCSNPQSPHLSTSHQGVLPPPFPGHF